MIKAWSDEAWEDFEYWMKQNKKTLKRILLLIKDIDRNGYDGIGKPEPLAGDLSGYWSRRIDEANRIVYRIENGIIKIVQCGSHYRDKQKFEKARQEIILLSLFIISFAFPYGQIKSSELPIV